MTNTVYLVMFVEKKRKILLNFWDDTEIASLSLGEQRLVVMESVPLTLLQWA